MISILITGAAGFLGRRLAQKLLAQRTLDGRPIGRLVLADLQMRAIPAKNGIDIVARQGDLSDPGFVQSLGEDGFDSLFHLASFLTLQAEIDPNTAFKVNVEALRRLMDGATNRPKVVFTSSIAIHGGQLPERVTDSLNPVPATTYGTHKAINELLISDYSRLGRIDGRSLRLPIVLTRPGAPTPAVSDKVASIMREPLKGENVQAPLEPGTAIPIVSAGAVTDALMKLHDCPASALPPKRAFNLPSLTVTIAEMVEAAKRHGATGEVSYAPDPQVQAIVAGWPQRFVSEHADRIGIGADNDLNALIEDYLENKDMSCG